MGLKEGWGGSQISPPLHRERRDFQSHYREERYSPHSLRSPLHHREGLAWGSRLLEPSGDHRLPEPSRDHRLPRRDKEDQLSIVMTIKP